jgi:hypothetical protein
MPKDFTFWAPAVGGFLAFLTLASFLGGYFALRKQVQRIDDSLGKVTEVLPDLARKAELQQLSTGIQDLRVANERLATKGQLEDLVKETRDGVQSLRVTAQEFAGILTIITKTQAEVSQLRGDLEILKSKTHGA